MPVPVLTVEQMREWEQATWATGVTEQSVIDHVGRELARRLLERTRPDEAILVLAGKGHNGDDARAAVAHLGTRPVEVLTVDNPASTLTQLKAALAKRPAWIVDALFGIGLDRPLDSTWTSLIEAVNQAAVNVLSVDVPSGLEANLGQPAGTAIQATCTLTIGAPKQGLLAASAAPFVGRLEVLTDVGLIPCYHEPDLWWTLAEDFRHYPPSRPADSHKGSFGHLSIVAGSVGYHGAAVLAARGAQRAKVGRTTVCTQDNVYPIVASHLQGAMVRPWAPDGLDLGTALLAGPGLAAPGAETQVQQALRRLWSKDALQPFIVDASALDWLPLGMTIPRQVRVVTPHPGEAGRMLNANAAMVQSDRLQAVRKISSRFGDCWVVLKGQHTLVGRSSGPVYVNSTGNADLAQGGSGDLLSGYIAGLLAQPALMDDPCTALRFAVWQHGAAADHLSLTQPNWGVEDLADLIGTIKPLPSASPLES